MPDYILKTRAERRNFMEKQLYTIHYDTFRDKWLMFRGQELVATYTNKWADLAQAVADTLNARENNK